MQTFGDLVNYHPHIHSVAPEDVFTESGYFVHIPETWKHRAVQIWQEKVFTFLVDEGRIDQEVVAMIKSWRHTGFSVDNSVRIIL
ncbi:MAG: transposase [Chitinispirillaceae bacterium]|nr:transposase [Chitinispirillaceae bacterium]